MKSSGSRIMSRVYGTTRSESRWNGKVAFGGSQGNNNKEGHAASKITGKRSSARPRQRQNDTIENDPEKVNSSIDIDGERWKVILGATNRYKSRKKI